MLFFWMPHEDGVAIQSKWVDGGWLSPGLGALAIGLTDTTERMIEYVLHGEQYLDVVATMSAGGTATLSYVDIFIVPR